MEKVKDNEVLGWIRKNLQMMRKSKKNFHSFCLLELIIFFVMLLGTSNQCIAESPSYKITCFALPDPHWIHETFERNPDVVFSDLILKATLNALPRVGFNGLLQTSKIRVPNGTATIRPSRELFIYYWIEPCWQINIDDDFYGASFTPNIESLYENLRESIDGVPVVHIPMDSDPSKLYPNGCSDLPKPAPTNTLNPDPGKPDCPQVPLN